MAAILKIFFASSPEPKGQLTPNLVGSIGVTYRSKIAKIVHLENLFFAPSPEPKGKLTPNLLGSIRMTCRSKIAKIVLRDGRHSAILKIYFSLLLLN